MTVKVHVEGMSCGHCVKAVSEALARVPGVGSVEDVSLERGEAVVSGQPDPAALIAAVEAEGYKARVG